MSDTHRQAEEFNPSMGLELPSLEESGFEELRESGGQGLLRRFLVTQRHLSGLALGGLADYVRTRPREERRGLRFRAFQLASLGTRILVGPSLRKLPFPQQLRRRLELLGPTYIKLGQVLSLRRDLLPQTVTDELENLLDRLPAVSYPRFLDLVRQGLGGPVEEKFSWIDPRPAGSASIAQSHRATTRDGEPVILKVVKPGIRETLRTDTRLLRVFATLAQMVLPRYQPKRVAEEFARYTLNEVDLDKEADNAEIFAANFQDLPDVVFPAIHRHLSSKRVLCMEYLDGPRPDQEEAQELSEEARDRLIDLGMLAIVRMLYQDGFFHADLHPGNLKIVGHGTRAGFIDLGMVGRLETDTRRGLLFYYYCLVTGDPDNAARYLAALAEVGPGGDRQGFRRAVAEVSRRWQRHATFEEFSLGQLILESVSLGAQYRIYFPIEMVLMVKALVTFEAVGHILRPGFDVASASRRHVTQLFLQQWNPLRLARESLRGGPELLDAMVKAPLLITEGLRLLEQTTRRPAQNPLAGIRGTLFGGFALLTGAILMVGSIDSQARLWPLAVLFFLIGLFAALNQKS